MAESRKYAHLVNQLTHHGGIGTPEEEKAEMAPAYDGSIVNPPIFFNDKVFPNAKVWCEILHAYAPGGSFGTPVLAGMPSGHRHNFDECFLFLGSNPDDIDELGGEVEFWLGEGDEAEKYMLTKSTPSISGRDHAQCGYRKVNNPLQPIILVVIATQGNYEFGENRPLPTDFKL